MIDYLFLLSFYLFPSFNNLIFQPKIKIKSTIHYRALNKLQIANSTVHNQTQILSEND